MAPREWGWLQAAVGCGVALGCGVLIAGAVPVLAGLVIVCVVPMLAAGWYWSHGVRRSRMRGRLR